MTDCAGDTSAAHDLLVRAILFFYALSEGGCTTRASDEELIREYERWLQNAGLAANTISLYCRAATNVAKFAQSIGRRLEHLGEKDLAAYAATLNSYSLTTQENQGIALRNFFKFLIATGRRRRSPVHRDQFGKRSQAKVRDRKARPKQVSHRLAGLSPRNRAISLVVGELLEKGVGIGEIFQIREKSSVGEVIEVESARAGRRPIALSAFARARLNEWDGRIPIGPRAFQRVMERVDLRPKDLGDPSRPGLADLHLALLPDESVKYELERRARPAFLRGEYDTAIFEAMKAVEVAVRRAGGFSAADIGVPMMRKAFDRMTGPLRDDSVVEAERQATSDLFAGAIGQYKNPGSHRDVDIEDPVEVAGVLRLADLLLRIVERAKQ